MVSVSLSVLKKRYQEGIENKDEIIRFKIKGQELEFVPKYLMYLIQHLENIYKQRGLRDTHKIDIVPRETITK